MQKSFATLTPGARLAMAILGILAACLLLFALQVERGMFNSLFSLRQAEAGLPDSSSLLLSGAWFGLLALPLGGALGDRFGRLRWIYAGVLACAAAILLLSVVSGVAGFALCQALMALGVGLALPNLLALFLAAPGSPAGLGSAAGVYLSGLVWLGRWVSQGIFFVAANYSLPSALVGSLVLAALACAAGGGLYLVLDRARQKETRPGDPYEARQVWGESWLLGVFLAAVFAFGVAGALASIVPSNLSSNEVYRLLTNQIYEILAAYEAVLIWAFLLGGLLSDLFNRWLSRRGKGDLGRALFAALGMLLLCLGLAGLAGALKDFQPDFSGLRNALILLGAGSGLLMPPLLALVAGQVRQVRWGLVLAAALALQQLGNLIGIMAVPFFTARYGLAAPAIFGLIFSSLALLALMVAVVAFARRR